jgi:hypothetical protein
MRLTKHVNIMMEQRSIMGVRPKSTKEAIEQYEDVRAASWTSTIKQEGPVTFSLAFERDV